MKRFDVQDLSNPETYQNNPDLEKYCRQHCNAHFRELGHATRAAAREAVFAGEHAEIIATAWDKHVSKYVAAQKQKSEHIKKIEKIKPLDGYRVFAEGDNMIIDGPYNSELPSRLHRQNGFFDREREVWVLPLAAVTSIQRIFNNVSKKTSENAEAKTIAEIKRWLGYVEDKAPGGYLYQNGVDKLRSLGIDAHPEYNDRLNIAIETAQLIRAEQQKKWAAEKTQRREKKRTAKKLRRLYPSNNLPAMNTPVRLFTDRIVVFEGTGKSFRIDENHPSLEGSHLLGHEGEYGCYCYYREATADEIADLAKSEQSASGEREREDMRRTELIKIRDMITTQGERPDGMNQPEGNRHHDTQNIYGSGDWFVIGQQWIWYVKNNGMDGDNWSRNNIRTGGAGAIGWRIAFDGSVADKIIALED